MQAAMEKNVPQWKRDLILRIRQKNNKWSLHDQQQLLAGTSRNSSDSIGASVQQPTPTSSSAAAVPPVKPSDGDSATWNCNEKLPTWCTCDKMVKERVLIDHKLFDKNCVGDIIENGDDKTIDSDSNEELHYGPGIVNKLKNRYLSLTLRENNIKTRPTILPMRKAASLENLLDDDGDELVNGKPVLNNSRLFQSRYKENQRSRNVTKRYHNGTRDGELKRAHSVETISRSDDLMASEPQQNDVLRRKHESLHEDMLIIKEGSDKAGKVHDNNALEPSSPTRQFSNVVNHKINRPKRIAPMMSEKEKPPLDVVKQTKKLFEGRADLRTKPPQPTGEVAYKVASYKNIIGQTKGTSANNNKKPPILKQKPIVAPDVASRRGGSTNDNNRKPSRLSLNAENGWKTSEKSPSPDIASVQSPFPDVSRINNSTSDSEDSHYNNCNNHTYLEETPDLIRHSSPIKSVVASPTFRILATDNFLKAEIVYSNDNSFKHDHSQDDPDKIIPEDVRKRIQQVGNINKKYNPPVSLNSRSHLPTINKDSNAIEQITHKTVTNSPLLVNNTVKKQSPVHVQSLTRQEIEKNNINKAKSLEQETVVVNSTAVLQQTVEEANHKKIDVPKTKLSRDGKDHNSIVFKFTDRKDVPDYVGNDGRICTGKIEKPKVGEGGIILLPGATLDESAADDDDDWMLSLEGPPSPCDVTFINDNVLIDGRSSIRQKHKNLKMKIKFVDSGPDIFEYPSETSLLDDSPTAPSRESSPGHIVPTLSGSSLANYIPKSGSNEDFQLGITRSIPIPQTEMEEISLECALDEPVLFSAGTNTDILF